MNENKEASQLLLQARTQALDHTAAAYRSILIQHDLTVGEGIDGIREIEEAASSVEDAIYYLAGASAFDDDNAMNAILDRYGIEKPGDLTPSEEF